MRPLAPLRRRLATDLALVALAMTAVGSPACSKPRPPTIAPEHATVTGVDAKSLHLDVALSATNPNSVDLTVRNVTAHVVVGKTLDLGSMTLPQTMTLPAGKASTIDAPMTLAWTDLPALSALVGASPTIPFTIDGTVELGGDLMSVTVPYHLIGWMTQGQVISATIRSISGLPSAPPPALR